MAIEIKEFSEKVQKGLKANSSFVKFYYNIKVDDKRKRGVFDYSKKSWNKKDRINKAILEVLSLEKRMIENSSKSFDEDSTLDKVSDIYFNTALNPKDKWVQERKNVYRLHIQPLLGSKKIKNITQLHIDQVRKQMQTKGFTKQTENGCSVRTIKKALIQSLKPILEYAYENRVLSHIPKIVIPKEETSRKKIVNASSEKLAILYKTIMKRYEDNGLYRGLFLLALYGRRLNEILTLDWNDVDFEKNTYTIRAENNKIKIDQKYQLPVDIAKAMLDIRDKHIGLVFKSPLTGRKLSTPKKQIAHIKAESGIEELTMHYFRHILVSAMGEMGVASTVLSASLGHTNLDTVNQFYLSANHTKSSNETNTIIADIVEG